jgi:hypothetical protein
LGAKLKTNNMSGLQKNQNLNATYVNIKEGALVIKTKDGILETYDSLEGVIEKVEFLTEQYEGKNIEKAKFYVNAVGELFILQIKTNSGYFRGLCNSLASSNAPKDILKIVPSLKKDDNGKPKSTCFVGQNGKFLKHAFTKENMGGLPDLDKVTFKGEVHYDNTKQIDFWKNFLSDIYNTNPKVGEIENIEDDEAYIDDLPF